jgi:predicted Rossmann fold nucleotide-binding protein DprA/Smf involved in DNA uptake
MRIAIIGSRNINEVNIGCYIGQCDEIVSGGAKGVDTCAAAYAKEHGIRLVEFTPQYQQYGRAAPIIRNRQIVDYADRVLAFWDGISKGTLWVIRYAQKIGKPCQVILVR